MNKIMFPSYNLTRALATSSELATMLKLDEDINPEIAEMAHCLANDLVCLTADLTTWLANMAIGGDDGGDEE